MTTPTVKTGRSRSIIDEVRGKSAYVYDMFEYEYKFGNVIQAISGTNPETKAKIKPTIESTIYLPLIRHTPPARVNVKMQKFQIAYHNPKPTANVVELPY
jgi:hypothetical protein